MTSDDWENIDRIRKLKTDRTFQLFTEKQVQEFDYFWAIQLQPKQCRGDSNNITVSGERSKDISAGARSVNAAEGGARE